MIRGSGPLARIWWGRRQMGESTCSGQFLWLCLWFLGLATSYGEGSVMQILLSMAVAVVLVGVILAAATATFFQYRKPIEGAD